MTDIAHSGIVCPLLVSLLTGLCLLAGGCIGHVKVPDDHFYTLPEIRSDRGNAPILEGTLAVDKVRADGLYKERSLLYVLSSKPLELQQYHYRHWAHAPGYLIQENLLAYMRSGNWAQKVIRYNAGAQADKIINGRLVRFERIVDNEKVSIMASLELQLCDGNSHIPPLVANTYSARIDADDASIYATVEAYGKALQQIYDGFINDINEIK
ncbi:MAG: ABC-type transport auxiliary lipoprotein family protein [bacterium]